MRTRDRVTNLQFVCATELAEGFSGSRIDRNHLAGCDLKIGGHVALGNAGVVPLGLAHLAPVPRTFSAGLRSSAPARLADCYPTDKPKHTRYSALSPTGTAEEAFSRTIAESMSSSSENLK